MSAREQRKESRVRTTKIEVAIHEALGPFTPEDDHDPILDLEVLEALARVSSTLTGNLRRGQIEDDS